MKNYVVIGGSSGIGKAVVHQLSAEGNRVYATYNSTDMSSESIPNVSFHPLDVTSRELDMSWVPEVVDGFVYAPGAIALLPFGRLKLEKVTADFNLQVLGAVSTLQKMIPYLKKSSHPSVVFFSTVAVQMGFNFHTQVAISKGAIEGLTRSLAAEFAPTIRINAIAPSITHTPLAEKFLSTDDKIEANAQRHPLKKIGVANDIAEMTVFLLSDKAKWMTGQIINVDGGITRIKM
ncbi:MAG: NAD(P)-dependent dehydrogenase (short-subunit alcohol dehydrogenase family) [Salibacteraceae bacterium]|jgi:NAD(P)-dependent dehydrogenase (short-subunit alcohol dehydrogenase family)